MGERYGGFGSVSLEWAFSVVMGKGERRRGRRCCRTSRGEIFVRDNSILEKSLKSYLTNLTPFSPSGGEASAGELKKKYKIEEVIKPKGRLKKKGPR